MTSHEDQILLSLKEGGQRHTRTKEVRPNTYQIILPFYHSDWDVIEVFAQEQWGKRYITDMWLTLMRLSYVTDIDTENKRKVYNDILSNYWAIEHSWKITMTLPSIEDIYILI